MARRFILTFFFWSSLAWTLTRISIVRSLPTGEKKSCSIYKHSVPQNLNNKTLNEGIEDAWLDRWRQSRRKINLSSNSNKDNNKYLNNKVSERIHSRFMLQSYSYFLNFFSKSYQFSMNFQCGLWSDMYIAWIYNYYQLEPFMFYSQRK